MNVIDQPLVLVYHVFSGLELDCFLVIEKQCCDEGCPASECQNNESSHALRSLNHPILLFTHILQVEELRARLEEKNKTIEKKTQQALQATQERNRLSNETNELRDHMDIKDRKINVLQRKVCY